MGDRHLRRSQLPDPLHTDIVSAAQEEPDRNDLLSYIWDSYDTGLLLKICAWCSRILVNDAWVAAPAGALSTVDEPVVVSHSICPTCAETMEVSPGS